MLGFGCWKDSKEWKFERLGDPDAPLVQPGEWVWAKTGTETGTETGTGTGTETGTGTGVVLRVGEDSTRAGDDGIPWGKLRAGDKISGYGGATVEVLGTADSGSELAREMLRQTGWDNLREVAGIRADFSVGGCWVDSVRHFRRSPVLGEEIQAVLQTAPLPEAAFTEIERPDNENQGGAGRVSWTFPVGASDQFTAPLDSLVLAHRAVSNWRAWCFARKGHVNRSGGRDSVWSYQLELSRSQQEQTGTLVE